MNWLVQDLIGSNQAVMLMGQPHNGKSWILEQLAVCIATGTDFLGHAVNRGEVIIIDEDSPEPVIDNRLNLLALGVGEDISLLNIEKLSMTGFCLWDDKSRNKIISKIKSKYNPVIIIDTFEKVMAGRDMNRTDEAVKAWNYLNKLKATGATILIAHHMSNKTDINWNDFDLSKHIMGNTQITAGSDIIFFTHCMSPKPLILEISALERRTVIPINVKFGCKLQQLQRGLSLVNLGELPIIPSKQAVRVFPLFGNDGLELTVAKACEMMAKDLSESQIRDAFHELEQNGILKRDIDKGKSHRYKYKLNPNLSNTHIPYTSYRLALEDNVDTVLDFYNQFLLNDKN